jgi:hypothetical protein
VVTLYHPHLNPIKLVRARVKGKVATGNINFKLSDVRKIACVGLSNIDRHYWIKCGDHVMKKEKIIYRMMNYVFFHQPMTVISLSDSSYST